MKKMTGRELAFLPDLMMTDPCPFRQLKVREVEIYELFVS